MFFKIENFGKGSQRHPRRIPDQLHLRLPDFDIIEDKDAKRNANIKLQNISKKPANIVAEFATNARGKSYRFALATILANVL